ncbi:HCP-like protein [Mucor ambiguus]|uniref:HCP-like protein n=1 Tax=Mucor ambiguus TaxID=91626 RepID=A0A0C9MGY3_9FUNG|nr:HCP-like protein [Mucor ambiguus]
MLGDFKNKLKSATPSIRSVKTNGSSNSNKPSSIVNPKYSQSSPVLSSKTSSLPPPPPAHMSLPNGSSRRHKEKMPANMYRLSTGSLHSTSSTSSSSNKSKPRSRSSCTSIDENQATPSTDISNATSSSTSSSSINLSLPPTPPPVMGKHGRYPSNISLPSLNSEYFLNHNHLKPGNKAELLSYDKTINLYRENAKRTNNPTIQCDLAIYLYESTKNNQKPEEKQAYIQEAIKILKTLSLRGHAESQYYLANIYASGATHKSGKPDFGNAFPLFVQAAKHQHADAAYRAAKCYEDGLGCLKNKSKAVQYYKIAATLSHPGAMYRLGLADINGALGLQRNVKDGNKWLKRSADAATPEYPHALHELGLLHEKGLDNIIFKDTAYSVKLYAQAAELGYAPSAYRLGECYEYGYLGCEKDYASSVFYYTIAARQGNAEACFALSAWYLAGDEPHIKPSEEKALYWAKLAAAKGLPKAEFALGYFAETGIGRLKDFNEAMSWYKKAAAQGNEQAKKRLNSRSLRSFNSTSKTTTANTTNTATATSSNSNNTLTIPSSLVAGEAR